MDEGSLGLGQVALVVGQVEQFESTGRVIFFGSKVGSNSSSVSLGLFRSSQFGRLGAKQGIQKDDCRGEEANSNAKFAPVKSRSSL